MEEDNKQSYQIAEMAKDWAEKTHFKGRKECMAEMRQFYIWFLYYRNLVQGAVTLLNECAEEIDDSSLSLEVNEFLNSVYKAQTKEPTDGN